MPNYQNTRVPAGRWVPGPIVLALGIASASVQLVPNRYYRLWSSVDAFFDVGPNNAFAATTSSHPLTGKIDAGPVLVDGVNFWLAALVASGTGVLYISEIDPHLVTS
jgi:hypothetical protein